MSDTPWDESVAAEMKSETAHDAARGAQRIIWLDLARGVGIILVVFGHTWRGLETSFLIPQDYGFETVDRAIYLFHMPLFFLLAGLSMSGLSFAGRSRPDFGRFLSGRAQRLLWPLALWTYIFIGLQAAAQGASHASVGFDALLRLPLPPYQHLWFLWALFLLQLVGVAVLRAPLGGAGRAAALIALGCLPLMGVIDFPSDWAPYLGPARSHLPAFALGLLVGEAAIRARAPGVLAGIAALVALGLCIVVDHMAGLENSGRRALGVVAAAAAVFAMRALARPRETSGAPSRLAEQLAWLGRASMAIYLMHVVLSSAVRAFLLAMGVRDFGLHLTLGFAAGLVGSLIALAIARRLKLTGLLGF